MTLHRITPILFLVLALGFHTWSQGQDQNIIETRKWKRYVGVGIHDYYPSLNSRISLEYGIKLKKRNEIAFTSYYANNYQTNYLSFSTSYHWSMIKNEKRRFNLFLAPELFFMHQWNHSNNNKLNYRDYDYIFFLGLIPQYRISKRFDLSLELKIGYGYSWYEFDGYFQQGTYFQSYGEWLFYAFPGLRLKYNFGVR